MPKSLLLRIKTTISILYCKKNYNLFCCLRIILYICSGKKKRYEKIEYLICMVVAMLKM